MLKRTALIVLLASLASGAFAAPTAPRDCASDVRNACLGSRLRCEQVCSDLTTCARRCCEAYRDCLAEHACAIAGGACPK